MNIIDIWLKTFERHLCLCIFPFLVQKTNFFHGPYFSIFTFFEVNCYGNFFVAIVVVLLQFWKKKKLFFSYFSSLLSVSNVSGLHKVQFVGNVTIYRKYMPVKCFFQFTSSWRNAIEEHRVFPNAEMWVFL